jgi:hypothetical protein
MVALPKEVMEAINNPKASKVLATVRADGTPHVVQAGSIMAASPELIVFGAIIMKQTCANLEAMKKKKGSITILVTEGMKSYQIKAKIKDALTEGPFMDKMNEALKPMGLKAHTVWTVEPTDVWNQSPSYEAGKKIA